MSREGFLGLQSVVERQPRVDGTDTLVPQSRTQDIEEAELATLPLLCMLLSPLARRCRGPHRRALLAFRLLQSCIFIPAVGLLVIDWAFQPITNNELILCVGCPIFVPALIQKSRGHWCCPLIIFIFYFPPGRRQFYYVASKTPNGKGNEKKTCN